MFVRNETHRLEMAAAVANLKEAIAKFVQASGLKKAAPSRRPNEAPLAALLKALEGLIADLRESYMVSGERVVKIIGLLRELGAELPELPAHLRIKNLDWREMGRVLALELETLRDSLRATPPDSRPGEIARIAFFVVGLVDLRPFPGEGGGESAAKAALGLDFRRELTLQDIEGEWRRAKNQVTALIDKGVPETHHDRIEADIYMVKVGAIRRQARKRAGLPDK